MSGSVQEDSCPTYATVDLSRKKKSSKNKNTAPKLSLYSEPYKEELTKPEISETSFELDSSADAVYSVLNHNEVPKEESEKLPKPSEGTSKTILKMKPWIIVAILLGLLTISFAIVTGFLFNKVLNLKKNDEIKYLNQEIQNMKETHQQMINYLLLNVSDIEQQRETIIQDIKLINTTCEEFKNDITEDVVRLNVSKLFRYESYNFITSYPSCDAIYQSQTSRISGHYWIRSPNGSSVLVYCSMTTLCNRAGGWRRVVKLDKYENERAACFPDLVNYGTNASQCVKNGSEPGCSHTVFPLHNIEYTHVCGMVEGYGYISPDGFCTNGGIEEDRQTDINGNFVDGISLTHLQLNKTKELWTYSADNGGCPTEMSGVPMFLNTSYVSYLPVFQVGGNAATATCPTDLTCVDTFHREFPQPISSDIEMRLCRGQEEDDEEIIIGNVEIYVL